VKIQRWSAASQRFIDLRRAAGWRDLRTTKPAAGYGNPVLSAAVPSLQSKWQVLLFVGSAPLLLRRPCAYCHHVLSRSVSRSLQVRTCSPAVQLRNTRCTHLAAGRENSRPSSMQCGCSAASAHGRRGGEASHHGCGLGLVACHIGAACQGRACMTWSSTHAPHTPANTCSHPRTLECVLLLQELWAAKRGWTGLGSDGRRVKQRRNRRLHGAAGADKLAPLHV